MREITFDTAKTVLVPAGLYAEGTGAELLRFNGMAPEEGELVVASKARDGIVAVMAVEAEEWNRYANDFERGEAAATSPFLDVATGEGRERSVRIHLTRENVYMAVWDGELRMAEVLPDNSLDSLLYYVQTVGQRFKLRKFEIRVGGARAGLVADTLRRYFKKVRVG